MDKINCNTKKLWQTETSTLSKLLLLFGFLFVLPSVWAQQSLSKQDYERALSFLWDNVNNKKAFNLFVPPNWFPDSTGMWYLYHQPGKKTFRKVESDQMKIMPLFDHKKVADILTDSLEKKVNPDSLPFNRLEYINKDLLRFRVERKTWDLDLKTYRIRQYREKEDLNPNESRSPDGKWIACADDYNLYIRSVESGDTFQLSYDGEKNYEYASYFGWYDIIEGEQGERPEHFAVNWSDDSRYLQAYICDLRFAEKMYLLDWSIDSLYRPKLLGYYRGSPGDTTMVHMIPVFFDVGKKERIPLDLPRNTHINSASFRWSETPGMVYMEDQKRGYQKLELSLIDLPQRKIKNLVTETSTTNIDNFSYWLVEDEDLLFFASERSGWRQLYRYDLNKEEINPLTKGEFYVNSVEYIDEKNGLVYFMASGREPGRNPYYQHLYRVSLNGKGLRLLTPEDTHHQVSFSPDGAFFVDNYSTAQQPTRTVLCEAGSGELVLTMAEADIDSLERTGWSPPETFEAIARDGNTIIYGALWKPTHFDPSKEYPVIDNSYTGPHTQVFPKDFQRVVSTENQVLAEFGFVVIAVDGMGSSGRSKAFHDVSYKHMGYSLTDHVLAIRQLGEQYSWIDTSRVGIFGHSAGGYDAGHAVLQFPDFYKVAVASSGDHDHRMEKAWWPEMYMGWPVDSAYQNQSNITMAPNLKGKLLLVHGGLDDNVNPSATFKLAEALIKADKEFDLLIIPSQRHGYGGEYRKYFMKKRWNYFIENLQGRTPLWDIDW